MQRPLVLAAGHRAHRVSLSDQKSAVALFLLIIRAKYLATERLENTEEMHEELLDTIANKTSYLKGGQRSLVWWARLQPIPATREAEAGL